jgi:S1/P1 Nuclease
MNKRLIALILTLTLTLASPAFAWWDYGHKTIATIAWGNVKPQTRTAIRALLAQGHLVETPTCPLRTLEDASYWPDCIKGLGARFDYAFSWHYQNVDICKPFDLTAPCKDGNCVSRQIERAEKLLKDKKVPTRERIMALAFLAHFVGDLHMPLHAGDRSDRGGNDLKATYGIVAGRVNLHSLWDGPLAERAITTPPAGPKGIEASVAGNAGEKWQRAAGTVEDWSRESWQVSRDAAYATAIGGDPCGPVPARAIVSNEVIEKLVPVARQQMLNGGLRLARLLDEALATP